MDKEKVRTGYRMPNGGMIEGTISLPYHDGREKAWTVVGFDPGELRALSASLADLAYRVEAANNATMTPMPKAEATPNPSRRENDERRPAAGGQDG